MRVLFTCRPGYGHFYPLVPLARAVAAAGHEVAFATGDPFRVCVEAAGFTAFRAGLSVERWREGLTERYGALDRIPRAEQRSFFFGHVFTDFEVPARAADLAEIVDRWRPDVLVHELAEFAGPLAAAQAGMPHATCGFGPLLQPAIAELAGEAVGRHWRAAGLDPHGGRLYRSLYLDPCPASLQVPAIAEVGRTLQIRPEPPDRTPIEPAPAWLERLPARPTVYFTLGTIFNREVDVFAPVLEGLADTPMNVIVTVGHDTDRGALGAQPDNVRLFGYLPQARVLGRCDLVIGHGGAGSTLGALAFGLPLLVLPRGADHFYNADRVLAAGAGRRLLDHELTPDAVASEVRLLFSDASYRAAATEVSRGIAAMPGPAAAVAALEQLARESDGGVRHEARGSATPIRRRPLRSSPNVGP